MVVLPSSFVVASLVLHQAVVASCMAFHMDPQPLEDHTAAAVAFVVVVVWMEEHVVHKDWVAALVDIAALVVLDTAVCSFVAAGVFVVVAFQVDVSFVVLLVLLKVFVVVHMVITEPESVVVAVLAVVVVVIDREIAAAAFGHSQ